MSTALATRPETNVDMVITFDVGPGGLDRFLDALQRSPGRLYYRSGRVTIVSPTLTHERGVWLLDEIVKAIASELGVGFFATRSTLFHRDDLDQGVIPDGSYYFANREAVRGVSESIDLRRYPPPDLVLEVVWTHSAAGALAICREMGVPEVWVYDIPAASIQFHQLDPTTGAYVPRPHSLAFPFLAPADVMEQIRAAAGDEEDGRVLQRLRAWARDALGPRRAGG